ncbi:MAG: dTDP-4-dehydrorhamnose 3,5-epimerase [Sphingomicrobium sp.]
MFDVRELDLPGVYEISPRRYGDDRGFFSEIWNKAALAEQGVDLDFVQDNHSYSAAIGVLRGLHLQLASYAQDKLVRVVNGAVWDVAVDLRLDSPTLGRWVSLEVSAAKWNQILVPKGCLHGFVTIEPDTEVIYKVTNPYAPEWERTVNFDDPELTIPWPLPPSGPQLSAKDKIGLSFADMLALVRQHG